MRIKIKLFLLIMIVVSISESQNKTSHFNQRYLKSIISIEQINSNGEQKPIGTGFIINTSKKHTVLVTAKHVVKDDKGKIRPNIAFRINTKSNTSKILNAKTLVQHVPSIKYSVDQGWFFSDSSDIACRFLYTPVDSDILAIPVVEFINYSDINVASNILILGFPLGLRDEKYSKPIARSGIIARKDNLEYLADAFIFPGNSGGPAIYVPLVKFGKGFNSQLINKEKLVGLVVSSISYKDIAISSQTKRPRVIFEENTGLCKIVPIEFLSEILNRPDFIEVENKIPN